MARTISINPLSTDDGFLIIKFNDVDFNEDGKMDPVAVVVLKDQNLEAGFPGFDAIILAADGSSEQPNYFFKNMSLTTSCMHGRAEDYSSKEALEQLAKKGLSLCTPQTWHVDAVTFNESAQKLVFQGSKTGEAKEPVFLDYGIDIFTALVTLGAESAVTEKSDSGIPLNSL